MEEREDIIATEIEPYDFEKLISKFVGKMGFGIESSKTDREGTIDIVAKSANPLGGEVISLIRGKPSVDMVAQSEVSKLFDDMGKMGAVRAAYITSSDFSEEAYSYAAGKPLSLVNRFRLFESISMSGVELDDEFLTLLDKYGLAEKYYKEEKHSFTLGKTLDQAKDYFEERAKSSSHPKLKPQDRLLRVEGHYTPVGIFTIKNIDEQQMNLSAKQGNPLHDEESIYIDLNTGELHYIEKGKPPKKGVLRRDKKPPENRLRSSTIIEDILLLPPESKSHLLDLLEHGDLPHEHLVGKHLSILEKRGVVHVYNLSDKQSSTGGSEILGFLVSMLLMFIDEILDFFGSMGETGEESEKSPEEKKEDLHVGARVNMPHHFGGIYNLREYLEVEEGLEEEFEVDQNRYRSRDIERILKSIFDGDVSYKGVLYLPYYECKYVNKETMRVMKREALLAPKIKQEEEKGSKHGVKKKIEETKIPRRSVVH
ncbi:restriction endonuclease [Candidatus Altiarchaeota archaeon]